MNIAYAAIMALSILCAALLSRRYQQSLQLLRWQRLAVGLGAFCGAMFGAKLPFVLGDWEGISCGTVWFADGKTILGGLVGGYLGVELTKWSLDIRVKTGDSFAVPVAVSIAIGRIACFVAGCCYGRPCALPWGVDFGDGIRRHPTQFYEFLFHACAAVILSRLRSRGWFRGQLIKLYILAYLVYRFVTEYLRPEPRDVFGLTAYQWGTVALFPVFVGLWIYSLRDPE